MKLQWNYNETTICHCSFIALCNETAMKLQWVRCSFIALCNETAMKLQCARCSFIVLCNETAMKLQLTHCSFIALCNEHAMKLQRACYIVIVICNERAVILRHTIAYPLQFHKIPLQKFQLKCKGFTAIRCHLQRLCSDIVIGLF